QSVLDPNAYNLTELCAQSISSAANDKSLNKCFPVNILILSLPSLFDKSSNNPTAKLNALSQLIKDTCALKPCSDNVVQTVLQSLKSQCSQELKSKNIIIITVFELFNYYDLVRDIICLRDSGNKFNSYCVLETLINIGKALNSTSSASNKRNVDKRSPNKVLAKRCRKKHNIDADTNDSTVITTQISFSSMKNLPTPTASDIIEDSKTTSIATSTTNSATTSSTVSSSTTISATTSSTVSLSTPILTPQSTSNVTCPSDMSLESVMTPLLNLPSQVICTDCNKAIFTKILLYTKNDPTAFNCTPFSPIISMAPGFFSQKCNPQFLNQNIPSSISGAISILKHVNVIELL
ncbi:13188_t:CDS:2, partial [Gigaspora rosea]